jgi:hypothetical protein
VKQAITIRVESELLARARERSSDRPNRPSAFLESFVRSHLCRGEVRPYIGAAPAASHAAEVGVKVGEADAIRPLIDLVRRQRDGMAAAMVRTEDEETAGAGLAHLAEGDLCFCHPPHLSMC